MEFNVKAFLHHHSPELFALLETRVDWNKLAENYRQRFEKLKSEYYKNGPTRYEASVYEVFMYAAMGRREAKYVTTYVTESIHKLATLLEPNELKLIADNLAGIVTNLDMKYLNFVGEIGILVIIKEHCKWRLLATEIENSVGKRLDFEFKSPNNTTVRVEIVNIHLTKNVSDVDDDIEKFLTKRIEDKINAKTGKDLSKFDFILSPVIWGPVVDLKKVAGYLKRNRWKYKQVLKPVAFVNFSRGDRNIYQRFKDLETIFDDDQVRIDFDQ